MPKLDTQIKPMTVASVPSNNSNHISNEDLMTALKSFKGDILSSQKSLSDLQASQHNELKVALSHVSIQMSELKAENCMLRSEIDVLKEKVASLEDCSDEQSQYIIKKVLQESFERDRCQTNLISYGVPESSTSLDVFSRIACDKNTFCNILSSLGNAVPSNFKVARLGKPSSSSIRPLKVIFDSKEMATHLLSTFNMAKRSGMVFLDNFRLTSDKTLLQRKLLRNCHSEMDQKIKDGESGLRIIFENGLPKVAVNIPKTEGVRHRLSSIYH